jgi:hypothetical protein
MLMGETPKSPGHYLRIIFMLCMSLLSFGMVLVDVPMLWAYINGRPIPIPYQDLGGFLLVTFTILVYWLLMWRERHNPVPKLTWPGGVDLRS